MAQVLLGNGVKNGNQKSPEVNVVKMCGLRISRKKCETPVAKISQATKKKESCPLWRTFGEYSYSLPCLVHLLMKMKDLLILEYQSISMWGESSYPARGETDNKRCRILPFVLVIYSKTQGDVHASQMTPRHLYTSIKQGMVPKYSRPEDPCEREFFFSPKVLVVWQVE